MKFVRWVAAAVLTLMSLMNIGVVTGDTGIAIKILGAVVGVAGLVAAFGQARNNAWGSRAAAGVNLVNLVLGIVGLVAGWEGSAIGTAISAVGLVLTGVSAPEIFRRRTALAG
ncbi:hypothetical protein [Cryptosporangium sp. NPDC051539]|uniref:hypothetical protein n=1 Tax=Cryptosporangium sp. NPDC051539 TaxID=3363962 RepID=UPI0037A5D608